MNIVKFNPNHFKNLNFPLNEYKRVHVNKSYVILFKVDETKKLLNFIDMTQLLSLFTFNRDEPMLFTSGLFWVLFLVFLPLYAMIKSRRKQMMLFVIAFSLFFFYKSSGIYFLLLVATSFFDWWVAQFIDSSKNRLERRIALTVSLVLSLSVLLFFKYSNFVMSNLEALIGGNFQPLDLILPVGISLLTSFHSCKFLFGQ